MRQRFVTLSLVLVLAIGALVLMVAGTAIAPGSARRDVTGPAGALPAGLPVHVLLGLGNRPDQLSWMLGSHVPWDARYMYLSGGVNTGRGWATWNSPAGAFALRYMQASGAHGYLPIFSYYQMLQSNPAVGAVEGAKDYNNLNNRATMKAYYADFRLLMRQARLYGKPVIVHVEPDLWGYMEQRAVGWGSCGRASCVSAAVASSGDADAAAYPNTVQGFAEALLHLRDKYAPNVIMALHASCWGSRAAVCYDTAAHAARDAAFLASVGITGNAPRTSSWDLLFTDTADRDAGFYQYVYGDSHNWWDPTNRTLPNFATFRTWLWRINTGTGRRIVLWQMPLGNQYFDTENNTVGHYQDNRAQYFLGDGPRYDHLKEFATAGVVGLLFGRGADGPTDNTDARDDGITNPAPVQSFQCNRCNTHVSHDSDDDGGYLRLFGGRYLKAGGVAVPVVRSSGTRSQASRAPMPLISRNVPAYASSEYSPDSPATLADDGSYDTAWRSQGTPAWLAYDLSAVPKARRRTVLVVWYNASYEYDNTVIAGDDYNCPKDYTIDVNAAPGGGSPPATGWVTLVRVRGNSTHSRQHLVDMAGYNWIRLDATASNGARWNYDIAVNMDVYDARPGVADDWIFFGDSITAGAMMQYTVGGVPSFAQLIHAARPASFPAAEDGGIPYLTSGDGARHVPAWLTLFPGRYVGLSYGTNDANGCVPPFVFYDDYVAMVQAVLKAGKIPVIPHIPWARAPNVRRCGPGLNAQIDRLYAAYPRIVRGPDLWNFFQKNQGLISSDNLHPTDQGVGAYRRQWAAQMLASVYK